MGDAFFDKILDGGDYLFGIVPGDFRSEPSLFGYIIKELSSLC
jgi:hypothetical protein